MTVLTKVTVTVPAKVTVVFSRTGNVSGLPGKSGQQNGGGLFEAKLTPNTTSGSVIP